MDRPVALSKLESNSLALQPDAVSTFSAKPRLVAVAKSRKCINGRNAALSDDHLYDQRLFCYASIALPARLRLATKDSQLLIFRAPSSITKKTSSVPNEKSISIWCKKPRKDCVSKSCPFECFQPAPAAPNTFQDFPTKSPSAVFCHIPSRPLFSRTRI